MSLSLFVSFSRVLMWLGLASAAWSVVGAGSVFEQALFLFPAFFLFMGCFSLAHDLMHRAFRLPIRVRNVLLSLFGAMNLACGHALVVMHARHHRRPLAPDDIEGSAIEGSLYSAVRSLPRSFVAYRVEAFRGAGPALRRWQMFELLLNAGAIGLAFFWAPAAWYVSLALLLQFGAPIWAGRIPHRAPGWLLRLARPLAVSRSPIVLSLLLHDVHHARAGVPADQLIQFLDAANPKLSPSG